MCPDPDDQFDDDLDGMAWQEGYEPDLEALADDDDRDAREALGWYDEAPV